MDSLVRLGVGWCGSVPGYSFPMRNAGGEIVGLSIRRPDGSKTSAPGSSLGLFMPTGLNLGQTLLLPEGASDTAALLDLGFNAVGRPSCNGGVRHTVALVRKRQPPSVVVVADADEPGNHGAQRLARSLVPCAAEVRVIEPPTGVKDVRRWKSMGATREDVMSLIRDAAPFRVVVKPISSVGGSNA